MELKLSGGGKIDFEAREFKSHLYGIEIGGSHTSWLRYRQFKSHLYGIEITEN